MVELINWLVIGILVVIGVIAIKVNHLKHKFFIVLLILTALFLYSTIALVSEEEKLDLKTSEGLFEASKVYTGWLANGFNNIKELTGKAIKMDWTSTDGEFFKKEKSKRR
jgi:CHASE2 domain-containing sensor protein|tara:strand:- start:480 stop:809 length:330 start_codon:yes stop_codon:yes gene_type:complete